MADPAAAPTYSYDLVNYPSPVIAAQTPNRSAPDPAASARRNTGPLGARLQGVQHFGVTDEQHFVIYDKDPKFVLARSVNDDGLEFTDLTGRRGKTAESVWAYEYGKGRVCFMAPGHLISALWNPEYEKMQRNAAKWLLRET